MIGFQLPKPQVGSNKGDQLSVKKTNAKVDPNNILDGKRVRAPGGKARTDFPVPSPLPSDDTPPMALVRANPTSTLPRKLTQTLSALVLALNNPNPDPNPKGEYKKMLIERTKQAIALAYLPVDDTDIKSFLSQDKMVPRLNNRSMSLAFTFTITLPTLLGRRPVQGTFTPTKDCWEPCVRKGG